MADSAATQNVSAPKPPAAAAKPKSDKKTLMVTYKPQPGDPVDTIWNGHKFTANVPRPVTVVNDANGVANPHSMIELAKNNKWFEVEGHDKKALPTPGEPKTPEEYKAYAVAWFKMARNAADFEARWDDEEEMRDRAGVGTDDVDWLRSIGNPLLAELKKADE